MKAPGVLGRLFVLFALTHGLDDVSINDNYTLQVAKAENVVPSWPSLSLAAHIQNSCEVNISSATIAIVGIIFLLINLVINSMSFKSCQLFQSPDLCIYVGSTSMGLVSLMLILTLLELCINISIIVMWCKKNCCNSREAISSPPNSVE
ncbi:membrane-spanning 4-domains subfamily A member 3-like [Choloepus didactylus]|uniref:membrane-spanning 4-domains subfamily A member 3-like n=1 Tax=Choloepus didactylus TaxID=27675 RepID=UPI0018A030D4|nr:membrane-spanning 4-domains subfamily A member 3-like [Choloepus didactylus]